MKNLQQARIPWEKRTSSNICFHDDVLLLMHYCILCNHTPGAIPVWTTAAESSAHSCGKILSIHTHQVPETCSPTFLRPLLYLFHLGQHSATINRLSTAKSPQLWQILLLILTLHVHAHIQTLTAYGTHTSLDTTNSSLKDLTQTTMQIAQQDH